MGYDNKNTGHSVESEREKKWIRGILEEFTENPSAMLDEFTFNEMLGRISEEGMIELYESIKSGIGTDGLVVEYLKTFMTRGYEDKTYYRGMADTPIHKGMTFSDLYVKCRSILKKKAMERSFEEFYSFITDFVKSIPDNTISESLMRWKWR